MSKYTITVACALLYYAAFFIISNYVMLYPTDYEINENCIIVNAQAVTGPAVWVVEGSEFLRAAIPTPHPDNLKVGEVEMEGRSLFKIFDYPDWYVCDWLICGRVTGTTDKWVDAGSGIIPIFEVEKIYPVMSVLDFLGTEKFLFSAGLVFKRQFIAVSVFFWWPIIVILGMFISEKILFDK